MVQRNLRRSGKKTLSNGRKLKLRKFGHATQITEDILEMRVPAYARVDSKGHVFTHACVYAYTHVHGLYMEARCRLAMSTLGACIFVCSFVCLFRLRISQ